MKAEGHPDYHEITIVQTDGTKFKTRSVWGKAGDEMRLDIDPKNHPVWQGGAAKIIEKGAQKKFESRYGGFFGSSPATKEEGKKGK